MTPKKPTLAIALLALLLHPHLALAAPFVWWEGEDAIEHNFSNTHFSASWLANSDRLSNGDWLNNGGRQDDGQRFAKYQITVPQTDTYHFWTRKFWKHGPFRYRFDNGDWQHCGRDIALHDSVEFQTHICANWVYLGTVDLEQGEHEFELELTIEPGKEAVACFDCFLLTPEPFSPSSTLRPGEKHGLTLENHWAFEPRPDEFANSAILDLSGMNEAQAGMHGFIRAEGRHLLRGDGRRIRFWGVNAGPDMVNMNPKQVEYLARRLAKNGVNLVRIHAPLFDKSTDNLGDVDTKFLNNIHYFVTAMKREGIYTTLSFYFPLWIDPRTQGNLAGYAEEDKKHPFAIIFFNPRFQAMHRNWLRTLLTTPNPHADGTPLGQDPAVAMIELVNEDSLFFWTFNETNIPKPQAEILEKRFGQWLIERYGSIEKALAHWDNFTEKRDDPKAGRVQVLDVWNITREGLSHWKGGKPRRMSDQARFMAELQRDFYAQTRQFIRQNLRSPQLVVASNWTTADNPLLRPLEHWTYSACDVLDRHGYFNGEHKGYQAAWSVHDDQKFKDRPGVLEPEALPIRCIQVEGKPQIISEIGWPLPNRLRAEAPLVCSTYGALQGIDGVFFFALNGPGWHDGTPKFAASTPSVLGQFPATALQYRRGDVAEAPVAEQLTLNLEKLLGFDEWNRKEFDEISPEPDPLAFFTGRVERRFEMETVRKQHRDLRKSIKGKNVTALNSAARWDAESGLLAVNTPRSQAVAGFLFRCGPVQLQDVEIDCANEYAAVHVISLDGKPLRTSQKILVQAFTREQPYGFEVDDDGRIVDIGEPPLNIENIDCTITLDGSTPSRVLKIDPHGYTVGEVEFKEAKGGKGTRIVLPKDSLYTVIER